MCCVDRLNPPAIAVFRGCKTEGYKLAPCGQSQPQSVVGASRQTGGLSVFFPAYSTPGETVNEAAARVEAPAHRIIASPSGAPASPSTFTRLASEPPHNDGTNLFPPTR